MTNIIVSQGQQKFSIKLNQKVIGSATSLLTQTDSTVINELQTQMMLVTLDDSTQVSTKSRFTETIDGHLIKVSTEYTDSNNEIFDKTYKTDPKVEQEILGPFGIQQKAASLLKQIGDSISFLHYSTDINQVIKTYRKINSKKFIDAKKIWITTDSTNLLPLTTSTFDTDFNLQSSKTIISYGEISLSTFSPQDSIISLYNNSIHRHPIRSNLILPNPQMVNAVALDIQFAHSDSTYSISLADNTFNPVPTDSLELSYAKYANQWVRSDDLDLFEIADSLTLHLNSDMDIALTLTRYCSEKKHTFPVIQLITMARSIFIPSRFVHGYHYQDGEWIYKYWSELGIDGEWILFDPNISTKSNPALYLPIGKSYFNEGFSDIVIKPDLINIEVKNYLQRDY